MKSTWLSRLAPVALILVLAALVVVAYHPWHTERESALEYAFGLGQQAARSGGNEAEIEFDRRFHGDREAHGAFVKGMTSMQNAQRTAN